MSCECVELRLMSRYNHEIPDQRQLWNRQHATRGLALEGSESLKFTPNTSAIEFSQHLNKGSTILEVGSANGRDARYWASLGHNVLAIDFSDVALEQMKELAIEQMVVEMVTPILWDIGRGCFPLTDIPESVDAFYARSALHIDDTTMYKLAFELDHLLVPGGVVFVEGKGPKDAKITRSRAVGCNLVIDEEEEGHLRRVWTCRFARQLCETMRWGILNLQDRQEKWNGVPATFMRLLAQKGY